MFLKYHQPYFKQEWHNSWQQCNEADKVSYITDAHISLESSQNQKVDFKLDTKNNETNFKEDFNKY